MNDTVNILVDLYEHIPEELIDEIDNYVYLGTLLNAVLDARAMGDDQVLYDMLESLATGFIDANDIRQEEAAMAAERAIHVCLSSFYDIIVDHYYGMVEMTVNLANQGYYMYGCEFNRATGNALLNFHRVDS